MASTSMQSTGFICRSCSRHLIKPHLPTSRAFSRTASTPMPSDSSPYSPYYVDIPFPPQRYAVWQPRAKGKRPVPREVFPRKDGLDDKKTTPEYIALVSKKPVTGPKPGADAPATEKAYIDWKTKMAAGRRKNILEGLVELHAQKQEREQIIAARSEEKKLRRAKLLAEDDPEDVKLTTPSILSVLRNKAPLTDPDREARLAKKRENYEAQQKTNALNRRENLHELYIRAHSFVFTEKQLDQTINQNFDGVLDYIKITPPDSRGFIKEGMGNTGDSIDEVIGIKDEKVIEAFLYALTGGSKRDPMSTTTSEERTQALSFDVLQGNLPMSNYGYKGNRMRKPTDTWQDGIYDLIEPKKN